MAEMHEERKSTLSLIYFSIFFRDEFTTMLFLGSPEIAEVSGELCGFPESFLPALPKC